MRSFLYVTISGYVCKCLINRFNCRQRVKDFKIRPKTGRRKDDWTEDEKYFAIYGIYDIIEQTRI